MGCVCSGETNEGNKVIPITILGLPGVGKTSLIEALAGEYNPNDPPIQTNGIIQREIEINRQNYLFFDVCGFSSHSEEWTRCVTKSEAVIIVFDPMVIDAAYLHIQMLMEQVKPLIEKGNLPTLMVINRVGDSSKVRKLKEELVNSTGQIEVSRICYINEISQDSVLKEFEWIESRFVC